MIKVRKEVHEAGLKLTAAEGKRTDGLTDWNLAERLVAVFREVGLHDEADFWNDVRFHLMEMEFLEIEIEFVQSY